MKRALFLSNSGSRGAKEQRDTVVAALKAAGLELIEPTDSSPENFPAIVQTFLDRIDCVVAAGGDGTSLAVAKAIEGKKLPMGVIPLGTANNLARSLGIPLTVDDAVRVIAHGHTQAIDVARVNGKMFLNVSGMGLSTQVNRQIPSALKKRWGLLAYVAYSVHLMREGHRFRATVECDGKKCSFRSRQLTVCNGKYFGSGMTAADDAAIDDGKLNLLSAHFNRWWKALLLVPLYWWKRHDPDRGLQLLEGRRIVVTTVPTIEIDTDGEITTKTPATYEIEPKALRIFCPEKGATA